MASANLSSTLSRSLSPLAGSLWIFFLLLSALVAPIWALDLGEAQIRASVDGRELQAALLLLSSIADVLWIGIAAIVVYSSIARSAGLGAARRWAALILACSWLVGALSVWSNWPLGDIHYTNRLGPLLGPVSIGWLLLWCVVILGARDTVLTVFPRASHIQAALFTGLAVALTDGNLELLASKTRAWWLWMGKSPLSVSPLIQSAMVWLVLGAALAWCLRAPVLTRPGSSRFPKSAQAFVILNILLFLAHLGNALRN